MVKKLRNGRSKTPWRLPWGFNSRPSLPDTQSFVSKQGDKVIIVMGPTGVGKSTFIREYTRNESVAIGEALTSCTQSVTAYEAHGTSGPASQTDQRHGRLVLVDTPGFDDPATTDLQTLKKIAKWLPSSYKADDTVVGVIYMHDITVERMHRGTSANLELFQKLCGRDSFPRAVILTSRWQMLSGDKARVKAEAKEDEAKSKWWRNLLDGGATVLRFQDATEDEAKAVVKHLIDSYHAGERDNSGPLLIQQELVDLKKSVPATEAGMQLKRTLDELLALYKSSMSSKLGPEQNRELQEKIDIVKRQSKAMKLTLGERVKAWFGF